MRDDLTSLIADNLHALPGEDGIPRKLIHFSQFALTEDAKLKVKALATDIAKCFQVLLADHGYIVTHIEDPKPADAEGYKTTHVRCGCGQHLLDLNVNPDMVTTLGPAARKFMVAKLQSECPRHE